MADNISQNEKNLSESDNDKNKIVKEQKEKMADWINNFKSNTLTRIQKFETKLESITKERNKLSKDLKTADVQLKDMRGVKDSLVDEIKRLRTSLENVQSEFKYTEEEKTDAVEKIESLKTQMTALEKQNNDIESDLKTAKESILLSKEHEEELKGKIRLINDKVEWSDKVNKEDSRKIGDLESKLDELINAKATLENDLKVSNKSLEESRAKIKDLHEKENVLKEKVASLEIVKKDL
ncbi:MAG: hypothetical protein KAJ08_14080, partial [Deltaproteobacteria bacterium]|nr:hypothetical protein [Deltaproteobacteria bacterium]